MAVFYLTESNSSGDDIGRSVDKVKFIEVNAEPTADREWIDTSVSFDTSDRLWWITHADPDNPALAEFDMPPLIDGLAAAQETSEPDLEYELEGVTYFPPPSPLGPHFAITAALDLKFWVEHETTVSRARFVKGPSSPARNRETRKPLRDNENGFFRRRRPHSSGSFLRSA